MLAVLIGCASNDRQRWATQWLQQWQTTGSVPTQSDLSRLLKWYRDSSSARDRASRGVRVWHALNAHMDEAIRPEVDETTGLRRRQPPGNVQPLGEIWETLKHLADPTERDRQLQQVRADLRALVQARHRMATIRSNASVALLQTPAPAAGAAELIGPGAGAVQRLAERLLRQTDALYGAAEPALHALANRPDGPKLTDVPWLQAQLREPEALEPVPDGSDDGSKSLHGWTPELRTDPTEMLHPVVAATAAELETAATLTEMNPTPKAQQALGLAELLRVRYLAALAQVALAPEQSPKTIESRAAEALATHLGWRLDENDRLLLLGLDFPDEGHVVELLAVLTAYGLQEATSWHANTPESPGDLVATLSQRFTTLERLWSTAWPGDGPELIAPFIRRTATRLALPLAPPATPPREAGQRTLSWAATLKRSD